LDLTPFIRELILINECVILRGFGGFDTSYKNASFDQHNNKFIPPGKKITFRPDWIVDNGALEKHIADTINITREEASEYIDQFVKELFSKINETGSCQLEGIGKFTGSEGKIDSFNTFEDENYLADSFGLDTLEVEAAQKIIQKPVAEYPKPIIHKHRRKTWWYIVSGLLLLLAALTSFIIFSNKTGIKIFDFDETIDKSGDTSEIIVFGAKKDVLQDSVMKSIAQALDQNTEPKKALHPTEPKAAEPFKQEQIEVVQLSKFYLVAGSFKSRKNAETMKMQLEKKGFSPEIITAENQFYNVTIGKFDNKSSASNEKMRIRDQLDQPIWIMEK
jgi:nucleoid DNA-binding protein